MKVFPSIISPTQVRTPLHPPRNARLQKLSWPKSVMLVGCVLVEFYLWTRNMLAGIYIRTWQKLTKGNILSINSAAIHTIHSLLHSLEVTNPHPWWKSTNSIWILHNSVWRTVQHFYVIPQPKSDAKMFLSSHSFITIFEDCITTLIGLENISPTLMSLSILYCIRIKFMKTCVKEIGLHVVHERVQRKLAHRKQVIVGEADGKGKKRPLHEETSTSSQADRMIRLYRHPLPLVRMAIEFVRRNGHLNRDCSSGVYSMLIMAAFGARSIPEVHESVAPSTETQSLLPVSNLPQSKMMKIHNSWSSGITWCLLHYQITIISSIPCIWLYAPSSHATYITYHNKYLRFDQALSFTSIGYGSGMDQLGAFAFRICSSPV